MQAIACAFVVPVFSLLQTDHSAHRYHYRDYTIHSVRLHDNGSVSVTFHDDGTRFAT